jgi:hypothetical protein
VTRPRVASLILAVLLLGAALPAPAWSAGGEGPLDRRPLILPPAYPAAPPGSLRLPDPTPPLILREPGVPADRRGPPGPDSSWTSGRTDLVPSINPQGRIIQQLEETPGRFERR